MPVLTIARIADAGPNASRSRCPTQTRASSTSVPSAGRPHCSSGPGSKASTSAERAGLDLQRLMAALAEASPGEEVRTALAEFEHLQCPGVPTLVVNGQRFFGKDRVDWVANICHAGG